MNFSNVTTNQEIADLSTKIERIIELKSKTQKMRGENKLLRELCDALRKP